MLKQEMPAAALAVPSYLEETYWWAYVHPKAVQIFERQWLVNLILWGNFSRLRDAALDALGNELTGRTLQVACVYGDLTARIQQRLAPDARLDIVDILPVQLANAQRKLGKDARIGLIHANSADLPMPSASYDRVLLFFLLHEMPEDVRRATLAQARRMLKPGGQLVIVDYHRPSPWNPLYWPMQAVLRTLEPFAMDLWRQPIHTWLPADIAPEKVHQRTLFGGLYQLLTLTV